MSSFIVVCEEQNASLLFPFSTSALASQIGPFYHIILSVAFHLPDHFKKQCIVNSLPEMRSNTYRALPTALSITINVSSSLHPVLTFITLVEMSNIFATITVKASRLRKVRYQKTVYFFKSTVILLSYRKLTNFYCSAVQYS